jgi:hypothetical protein
MTNVNNRQYFIKLASPVAFKAKRMVKEITQPHQPAA